MPIPRCRSLVLAVAAIGVAAMGACSPAGVRDWAVQVQDRSAQGFAEQQNQRQLSAWQAAGEGGTVRRPPPPETPAEGAEAKPAEDAAQPAPTPQYIFVMPAQQ